MRARAKCTSASPRRRSRIPTTTASTPPSATSCSPPPTISKACGRSSAPTRSPSSPSTASTAPWARTAATLRGRSSPTIASPANIRRRSPTTPPRKRRRGSCRCSPRRADTPAVVPEARAVGCRESMPAPAKAGKHRHCHDRAGGVHGFRHRASRSTGTMQVIMPKPLADRIALITGASRGIGHALALKLAEAGAHVVALARTVGGLEELDDAIRAAGGSASLVPLDLKDYDGIDRLGATLAGRYGRLDVLVGNAGILGPVSPLGHVEMKSWTDTMMVNANANFQLVRCMEPLLKQAEAGRCVFLTSGAASNARAYRGPYSLSKAALDVLVRTYAAETASTPVKVNLFNPGPTRTRMRATLMPGEDPETLPGADDVAAKTVELCLPD